MALMVDADPAYTADLARRLTNSISAQGGEVVYHGIVECNATHANTEQATIHAKRLMEIGARVMFVEAVNGAVCIRTILTALQKAGAAGKGFALIAGESVESTDLSGSTLMDGMIGIRQTEGRKAELGFSNDYMRIYVRRERRESEERAKRERRERAKRESEKEERYRGGQRKRTTLCSS